MAAGGVDGQAPPRRDWRHMNLTRIRMVLTAALVLALVAGCAPRRKLATERERKEAELHASEARFALSVKEWARAEGLFLKAAQSSPEGDYYLSLGSTRMRLGKRAEAKEAYQDALRAYEDDAAREATKSEPWIKQAYVLAVLGRMDDARAIIAKAAKRFPNDAKVRAVLDPKGFEQLISGQNFKEAAL